jgi:hypothetical protein
MCVCVTLFAPQVHRLLGNAVFLTSAASVRPHSSSTASAAQQDDLLAAVISNIRSQLSDQGQSAYLNMKAAVKAEASTARFMSLLDFRRLLVTTCRLRLTADELDLLVARFPSRKAGCVDADAVVTSLRCQLSERRTELVGAAFGSLPANADGEVDVDVIARAYDAAQHPEVRSGRRSQEDMAAEFKAAMRVRASRTRTITRKEFDGACVGAVFFVMLVYQCLQLPRTRVSTVDIISHCLLVLGVSASRKLDANLRAPISEE